MYLEKVFEEMYPHRQAPELLVKYSGHFKDFNANVHIHKEGRRVTKLVFSLSKALKDTDESIQTGVIQYLLNKVYKTKISTDEQAMYNNFIRHIGRYTKAQESDPLLVTLYHELNEEYFDGLMEQPTMAFVGENTTTLGKYDYVQDLVTMSSVLKEERELLKFVLYHELLHKKHSFNTAGTRTMYHTQAFREDERKFHDKDIEKKLDAYIAKKKWKKKFKLW